MGLETHPDHISLILPRTQTRLQSMPDNAIVLLSGGIDSAACTRFLQDRGVVARCIFVDYGQAAARHERLSASSVAKLLAVDCSVVEVVGTRKFGAGKILGRNGFLILTALLSADITSGTIALGIHAGTQYYDCTPAFLASIDRVVAEYSDGCIHVIAPFISWSKKQIFDYYVGAGLPTQLTYSCEAGTDPPCGECASCQDRRTLGCNH